jgi:Na+/H+-dicarboxylate symporter
MKRFFQAYFKTSLLLRIILGFVIGSLIGGALWIYSANTGTPMALRIIPWVAPFGNVFVKMLKMIVVPVIFFSLVVGAASLPINKFGRVGGKTMLWYFLSSLLAAVVGTVLALFFNPGAGAELGNWKEMAQSLGGQASDLTTKASTGGSMFSNLLLSLFQNPFQALAQGNFLPIIVFAIVFGLAIRVSIEANTKSAMAQRLELLISILQALRDALYKMVDWILEYSPVGVLALSIVNFSLYGPKIIGPYVRVTLGVATGILTMILVVYTILLYIVTRENPFRILKRLEEAMIMAFITRSSAATLPVSIKVATEKLKIRDELASFSLPLGATINMDGVCVHLPMFAVLAANMFGITLTPASLATLVITTVLASIGAGGVPGGSVMLLFIILQNMGLSGDQVGVIVALALGINPILDMFETMNNVTGDLVCTYAVAKNENLIEESENPG